MLNMPRLSERERIDALMMLGRGDSVDVVSRAFNCHRNTIRALRHAIDNLHDLRTALQIEWNNIPGNVIQRYVDSMRLVRVVRQNGGHAR